MYQGRSSPQLAELSAKWGVHYHGGVAVMPRDRVADWKRDYRIAQDEFRNLHGFALDAQPFTSTSPNDGIPAFLTTLVDPEIIDILLAPNKAAEIMGEVQKGTWLDETMMFTMVEPTGEVTSYGDFNNGGHAGVNMQFPQRQSYLYQIVKEYGEREEERAGLAKVNWANEINKAAVVALNKFQNRTYCFGVAGLQNYGLLNDPSLSAALTPATKAAGGTAWINSSDVFVASANEIFADIQMLLSKIIAQTQGIVEISDKFTLGMSPRTAVALTTTNSFGITAEEMIKKSFSNIEIKTMPQYGKRGTLNPEGVGAGEMLQLIADNVEGMDTGYCAYSVKAHSHPVIRDLSSFKQKQSQSTWGCIIRRPLAIATMVGV